MVYLFDTLETFGTEELAAALEQISPQRRETALKYRFEIDRKLCVKGYLLLKQGLREEYGITDNPVFEYMPGGKPFLPAYPDIHFNISHCKRAVVCIIDRYPVGIDIEEIRPFDPDVAAFVCSSQEYDMLLSSPEPDIAFIALWTQKESLLKLTGAGIHTDLKRLSEQADNYVFETRIHKEKNYIRTVCRHRG